MARTLSVFALAITAVALYVGCGGLSKPDARSVQSTSAGKELEGNAEQSPKPGTHGGRVFAIGADSHHAEVRFEDQGVLRLYLLGKDRTRAQAVESQTATAYARAEELTHSVPFEIEPEPQPDDPAGKSSQFKGQLPEGLWGKKLEITVPVNIGGERLCFTIQSPRHDEQAAATQHAPRGSD
jgi:hypothetical protein